MKVWKYPLDVVDRQTIHLPYNAKILTAQIQGNVGLNLWALVDDEENLSSPVVIAIYGTGNEMPNDPGQYIDTFQLYDGAMVFHVFQNPKDE